MKVLGLDPAQNTGYAIWDDSEKMSTAVTGTMKAGNGDYEHMAMTLAQSLVRLIKQHRPDIVVIEQSLRNAGGPGVFATISSNFMAGALCGIVGAYYLPLESMPPSVWRKASYGFGTRKGWERKDWKQHAIQLCGQFNIRVKNNDEAEAVWIAFAGSRCQTARLIKHKAAQ